MYSSDPHEEMCIRDRIPAEWTADLNSKLNAERADKGEAAQELSFERAFGEHYVCLLYTSRCV